MIVVQLTDTHIVARGSRYFFIDTARHLRHALAFVERMTPRPDAVVLSGDLTNLGRANEYAHVRELLASLALPWYALPGNHDHRRRFRAAFADRPELAAGERIRFAIDAHPVRLIGLDSVTPKNLGGIGGGLDTASLDWLETQMQRDARPALIFLHHPPFATGMRYIDVAAFENVERFWQIVSLRRGPVRVAAGHVHSVHAHARDGVLALTSRSTSPQIVPEVLERRPFWLRRERPGFTLHRYDDGGGFESIDYVGDGLGDFAPAGVVGAPTATLERATPAA